MKGYQFYALAVLILTAPKTSETWAAVWATISVIMMLIASWKDK
mgnify:CR=1 FL=1